LAIRKKF